MITDAQLISRAKVFAFCASSNIEVMQNMEIVLDTIHAALVRTTPTPNPSPQGGGELET